jgi:ankyrin repeat protein
MSAAQEGHKAVVELLLKKGAAIDSADNVSYEIKYENRLNFHGDV